VDTTDTSKSDSRAMRAVRMATLAILGLTAAACGTFIGATSQLPALDREKLVVGPEVGWRDYALNSQGFIFGGRASFLPKPEHSCCYEFRVRGDLGYGVFPLLHESHWGFETTLSPTLGNVEVDDKGSFAVGGEFVLAAPFRVNPSKDLWQQNALSESIWMIVPSAGYELLVPMYEGNFRPVSAFEIMINVRFTQWPTVVP
jgi:hypothetical protein